MGVAKILSSITTVLPKTLRLEFHIHKRYQSILKNLPFSHTQIMTFDNNKAYFRVLPDSSRFSVSFLLDTDDFTFKKPVTVVRPVTDTVSSLLEKLDHKILQQLEKKYSKKKKKKDERIEFILPDVKSVLLNKNEPVTDIECEKLFEGNQNGEYVLKVCNVEYDVFLNCPWIENIKLPSEAYSGLPYHPKVFEAYCVDKSLSEFVWYRSAKKNNDWVRCHKGYFYIIQDEDVGHQLLLSCTPKNQYLTGPEMKVMCPTVLPFEKTCFFEKRHTYTKTRTPLDEIRIVSYNILADIYAETKDAINTLFSYCPLKALSIDYRRPLILKELHGYNADLVCLQEVDSKMYDRVLRLFFEDLNCSSEYFEKGAAREGTAIFFNNEKFKMLKSSYHMLSDEFEQGEVLRDLYDKLVTNESLMVRLKRLGTTLQVLVLQSLAKPSELIIVGNTHLYFHPDADHIRLLQGVMCMKILEAEIEKIKIENPGKNINLVFCGDFNSVPSCGIYQLMLTGSVDSNHIDWKSNEAEAINDVSYSHSLKIGSACGTPKYTNYTVLFKDCLDYIYYQTDRLEVTQVVPFPSEKELSEYEAIPSEVCPSDHVALIADLKWKV